MRKSEFTDNKLRNAFIELYKKKPVDKIAIREVSELAETARGTFYIYYQDIYDLLETLESEMLQGIALLSSHNQGDLNKAYDFIDQNRDMLRALLGPYSNQSLEYKIKTMFQSEVLNKVARQDKVVTKTMRAKTEYTSSAALGMLKMFLFSDHELSKTEIARSIQDYSAYLDKMDGLEGE